MLAGNYRVTAYINIMIIQKDIDLDDINIEIAVLFTIYYSLMKTCVKMKNVVWDFETIMSDRSCRPTCGLEDKTKTKSTFV